MPGNDLERLGDVLAKLYDPLRAAGLAAAWRRDHDPLARQVRRERLAPGAPARVDEGRRHTRLNGYLGGQFVLGRGGFKFLELEFELIEQPRLAL